MMGKLLPTIKEYIGHLTSLNGKIVPKPPVKVIRKKNEIKNDFLTIYYSHPVLKIVTNFLPVDDLSRLYDNMSIYHLLYVTNIYNYMLLSLFSF